GKEYTSETTKIPLYDEKGESVGVIGIYNDISDRVKIEQDLQESEEKYRSFVQNFNGIAFKGTLDFQPIFFHGAVEEITGYTEEEFISKSLSWDKIIHPEDFEKLIDSREKLKTTTNFFTDIDYRIIRKNGEIRWINEIIGNSCDENGKPIHVQGCIHDHTERKVIEEKIKENEEKFRILYNEMEQAYALYEAIYDKKGDIEDGILVEVNSEYEKLVNKKREEIIGKKLTEIYPNLKKQEVNQIALLGRTAITGETVISEYYNKDIGKWLLAKSFSPMKNHAAILFEDITEKRKMERELEKERKATQQYLDIVNIILTVIDANENVILVNKKGCELLGYEQKDIIGKNWFDNFLPKRVRDKTKEVYQELMAGKITQSESRENLVLTKDGEERLIAWDNTYIKDEEGTIVSTLSSGRDITEIRKTQRELKESEIRFKGIFNHSNDGYVLRTVDGIVLEANPRFLELFGREYSEVISNNIRMINVYETDEDHISRKKEIDEKGYAQFETLATRKDGSLFPMEVNAIKLLLADEELVFVIIRDITERKKTEEKIKSSEALYKALFDNTGTAMMLAEKDFTIALVNKLFLEKSGLSQDELLGKKWTDFIQKTERENIMKTIKRMGTDFTPPITFETSEFGILGENKTLLITIGINPETSQSIASLIDITGMKELEKELSKSEEKYRVLFNNVPVALSQTKPSGEIVECNSAFLDIFGYKNAEELKKIKIEELYFDPSEREAVLAVKDEVGYHDSLLQKMKKKDNTPIWVEINSKTSYDENHNVSHYDTSLKDVTEKKEMEARLKQSEEKFRSIFNHSVDGYILRDDDGTVMEYNPKLLEIFGYRVEDLDGVDVAKFDMRENIDDLQK
ncbi:MAG: PAS domain S-box protein, partial [Candidatus Heimdallarchaeota archaeon]|nr:PAS domain S-box protein [Candidatus Heimdallarchaeota archaeon]MCK4877917.1 PAS domain S-box protein [Candidatus Heimdallarchaeota archaeon]